MRLRGVSAGEDGESVAVLKLNCHPRLFGYLTLVEIGPLRSERNIMQGDIITGVACRAVRARVSVFKIEFVCCQRVESKGGVPAARVGCKACARSCSSDARWSKIKRSRKRKVRWVEGKAHGVTQDSTCIVSNITYFVTA